jgi:hypothetical protein
MALRWMGALALICAAAGLGGCAESMPFAPLPEVGSLPQKVLSKDEQEGKVNEMIARSQTHQTEAARRIENGK